MRLNIDSPWIRAGIKVTNLLILNFWFVIGCLPLVTIGASLIAAFKVGLNMVRDAEDSSITRLYWKAWKDNLAHGMLLTLFALLVAWGIWMNFQIFAKIENAPLMMAICGLSGSVLLYVHLLYAFLLEARYENSVWMALVNSRKICMRFFLKTLLLTGILIVQIFLFYGTSPFLTYIGLFCAPAIMIYTICRSTMPLLEKIEKDAMASDGFSVTGA